MSIFTTFPKYFRQSIMRVSETGHICVITFWTKKEEIYEMIPEKYRKYILCIGNLYTENGIQYIVKNSLLCPQIREFILIGNDKNNVRETFLSKEYYYSRDDNFKRFHDAFVGAEDFGPNICFLFDYAREYYDEPITAKNVKRMMKEMEQSVEYHKTNESKKHFNDYWISEPIDCYEEKSEQIDTLPSEHQGFIVKDKSLENLWHKALSYIKRFGIERTASTGKKYREILGLVSILEASIEPVNIPEDAPLSSTIEEYSAQIITDSPQPGIEYTYGQRLHEHGQIDAIIDKLKSDKANRQAIGVTWNLPKDSTSPYPPCCVVADFKIQPRSLNGTTVDALYLMLYFRSHDIYSAYCANIYGFRKLQEMIATFTDCVPGYIMVVSNSAHVYDYDYPQALIYDELGCRMDPRGYFIIEVIDDQNLINSWFKDGLYQPCSRRWLEYINASIIGKEWRVPYKHRHAWIRTDEYDYITEICGNTANYDPWTPISNAERALYDDYRLAWFDEEIYHDIRDGTEIYVRKPKTIKLTYMSPADKSIASTTGLEVQKLCDFAMPYISEISHAMYLGRELQRARNCIDKGEPYEQP